MLSCHSPIWYLSGFVQVAVVRDQCCQHRNHSQMEVGSGEAFWGASKSFEGLGT